MKPTKPARAEYRNEVKTRLRDVAYEALQTWKALHGIDSDFRGTRAPDRADAVRRGWNFARAARGRQCRRGTDWPEGARMSGALVEQSVALPVVEAADLAMRAAAQGVSTPDYLGYHVLRSAYGVMHPAVIAFEKRPQVGTVRDRAGGLTVIELWIDAWMAIVISLAFGAAWRWM